MVHRLKRDEWQQLVNWTITSFQLTLTLNANCLTGYTLNLVTVPLTALLVTELRRN